MRRDQHPLHNRGERKPSTDRRCTLWQWLARRGGDRAGGHTMCFSAQLTAQLQFVHVSQAAFFGLSRVSKRSNDDGHVCRWI
jgi:hypothetical protein